MNEEYINKRKKESDFKAAFALTYISDPNTDKTTLLLSCLMHN